MTLRDIWQKIQREGPTVVMLNRQGDTLSTTIAKQKNPDLRYDLIYIRQDGWSLGCEYYYAETAERLHPDKWVALIRRGDLAPKPFRVPLAV
jgi:hypothetical protein